MAVNVWKTVFWTFSRAQVSETCDLCDSSPLKSKLVLDVEVGLKYKLSPYFNDLYLDLMTLVGLGYSATLVAIPIKVSRPNSQLLTRLTTHNKFASY